MNQSKIKVIFFGTPEFAVPALSSLVDAGYDIVAVITKPDEPQGRKQIITPPPIKIVAEEHFLNVLQPVTLKDPEVIDTIGSLSADLGVVVAYGKIISREIIDLFPQGLINIHPSLLPQYRGPSPIQSVLLAGDTMTGVSIMCIDDQVDHGPILAQKEYSIIADDTYTSLEKKLSQIGAELLIETLPGYLDGSLEPRAQDDSQATFSKLIKTEDAEITVNDTAQTALNKIRALNPEPGTYMVINGQRIKILTAEFTELIDSSKPIIALADGRILLCRVQPAGKIVMDAADWWRGRT